MKPEGALLLPELHNSNSYPQALILAYFPKVGLCDLHPICMSVSVC
jgi:hypothetical protein